MQTAQPIEPHDLTETMVLGVAVADKDAVGSLWQASWASLVAQMVKNLSAVQENQVRSLGQEDLLEKEMATHSSILAWEIPWTEAPEGLHSMGSQRARHN